MSTEPAKQKRKDKKKKKAMLEALQQEEYYEERAHVRLDGPLDDDEENFVVHPTDDSDEGMPILEEGDGSGACAKIIFLVLLSSLGLAVGVIFFEMGGIDSIKGFTGLSDIEQTINVPLVQPESPVASLAIDDTIKPSPIQTDAFQDIDANVIQEAVQEVEENNLREEVPETIVPEENEQVFMEPVVEVTEHVENEETETSLAEPVEDPVVDVTEKVSEFVKEVTETFTEVIQEIPLEVNENFEAHLEDDPVEIPQESFTMRAEREAVQEAVDQVWVMTVRCIEELRALQVLAKASLTQTIIDNISQRLEPLRSKLDELVKNTSDSIFDGALEQAAELERNLRAVLDDLDQARKQDTILAEEAAIQEEELAAQSAQMAEEVEEEAESEIQAEEVYPNDEQYANEVVPEGEVVPEPERDLKEDTVLEPEEASETATSRLDKADPETAPEVAASEVVSAFSEVQEIEFEIQADEPIAQHEETVDAVANQDAVEPILEPENIESVEDVPELETIVEESVEEQIIYEAPEVISGTESAPVDESLELVQPQPNEVEEPVQVAAEAFVVGQQEEQALKQNTGVPSRMQNLEEADRLVDQAPPAA